MIRQIVLRNWQAFRGEHIINLEPKAYAVTASYETDPARSNWAGKSALFEAVKFALTGWLAKERRFDADGWITKGEKEGGVGLVTTDGVAIKRERKRGKSTQVRMSNAAGEVASQDEATTKMLKYLAFGAEDYETIAYFPQGAMSRLIRTEPEKRFDIVRGWFNLAKAEQAEEDVAEIAVARVREVQKLRARLAAIVEMQERDTDSDVESDETVIAAKRAELRVVMEEGKKLQEKEGYEETIHLFEDLIARGKVVAKEITEEYPTDLKERAENLENELRERYVAYQDASRVTAGKRVVHLGKFDGKCPVADITCPATKQINDNRTASTTALEAAMKVESAAKESFNEIKDETNQLIAQAKELAKKNALRESLKEQAAARRDDVIEARRALKEMSALRSREVLEGEADALQEQLDELNAMAGRFGEQVKQRARLAAEHASITKDIDREAKLAGIATQSRAVLRATQRRVAERALNIIGSDANDMLLTAGVDLGIDIQWEREGKGYAKACEMCGMAFPSSAKVKECETCGAERGQHIVQRLEFNLTNRSGAADDFAGIALQLSAGSWLLRARNSPWATAMIDEPFSQMDRPVRLAAAKQLITLLGTSAFRQVFVISHSSDTVSMYPARLNIIVARDGSRRIETT